MKARLRRDFLRPAFSHSSLVRDFIRWFFFFSRVSFCRCLSWLGCRVGFRGCSEMEKSFIVESKSFIFSALEGATRLKVGEKRNNFFGEFVISVQCSEWLVSSMESLLGYPEDIVLIKSFREGSKLTIARRDSNQAGRFLEVAVFGLGGRKGLILIPEGRGGWGWLKFSEKLRKAAIFLSTNVGCEHGSSLASFKTGGEEEEAKIGLAPHWKGPSFVEVLRSGSLSAAGKLGAGSDLPVSSCLLDFLMSVKSVGEEIRTAVDCSSLESAVPGLLGKDRSFYTLGKKTLFPSILNFERSKRNTWSKLRIGSNLALGRVVKKVLDRLIRTGQGRRRKGLRLAVSFRVL
jgi:hypothetical protein